MKKFNYVYILKNLNPIDERIYYIGCRSCDCDPNFDEYYSSSKDVLNLIKLGYNFEKKILKIFDNREDAISYEIEMHNNFNVSTNVKFYNKVKQSSTKFDTTGIIFIDGKSIKIEDYRKSHLKYHSTGKISVKDNDGLFYQVDVNDKRYLDGELINITKDLVPVYIDGKSKLVSKNEYYDNKDKYVTSNKNKIVVVDKNGNKFLLDKLDEERYNLYLSGELKSVHKGKILAKDKNANVSYVTISEFKKLNLVGINKGNVSGGNNPNAKKINIYNEIDELVFECVGNFKKVCIDNKLPFISLCRSYRSGGVKIFNTKRGINDAFKKGNDRFINWYAIEI
jgi:hypothetical protein